MVDYPKRNDEFRAPFKELVTMMERVLTPLMKKFLMQEKELAKAELIKNPGVNGQLIIILEKAMKGTRNHEETTNKWFPKWKGAANIQLAADSIENINKIDSDETVRKLVAVVVSNTGPEHELSDKFPYPVVMNNHKFKKGLFSFDLFKGAQIKDQSWGFFDECYQWKVLSSLSK